MSMKTKPSYLRHINMKYEKRSFVFLGSNMKCVILNVSRNMIHKRQPRKIYNMKYEKKKAFCDFVSMKYEKFNGQKT